MRTIKKVKIYDKEIDTILKKAQQQKWLKLMMALIDIENTNEEEINKFSYNNDIIDVETKDGILRYFIGDNNVQDNYKDKFKRTKSN